MCAPTSNMSGLNLMDSSRGLHGDCNLGERNERRGGGRGEERVRRKRRMEARLGGEMDG